jgi:hypothetical protein
MVFVASLSASDEATLSGTVYPVDWDERDNVTKAVIISPHGTYQITNDETGQALLRLKYGEVRVKGITGEDALGNPTITVIFYETVKE